MILSNVCILVVVIFFLFITSIRLIEFIIIKSEINVDTRTILAIILFLLLSGALIPRVCIWLF